MIQKWRKLMSDTEERWVVVTTVSQFRERYAIPVSELNKLNNTIDITNSPAEQITSAKDLVTMEEVKEFSQEFIGESIVDTFILDKDRILQLFNKDNEYLSDWTDEKKLDFIAEWKLAKK
jgi:hypothetical protein